MVWSPAARADRCDAFFAEARSWAEDNGWTVAGAGTDDEVQSARSATDVLALARENEDQMRLVRIEADYAAVADGPELRLSGTGPFVVCGEAPWEFRQVRAQDVPLLALRNVGWTTGAWQYGPSGWLTDRSVAVHVRNTRLWLEAAAFALPSRTTGVVFEETPDGDPARELVLTEVSVASEVGASETSTLVVHSCTEPAVADCGLDAPVFLRGVQWTELDRGTLYEAIPVGLGVPVAALSSTELTLEDTSLQGIASQLSGTASVRALGAVTARRSRFASLRDGGVYAAGAVHLLEGSVVSGFVGATLLRGSHVVVEDSVLANVSGFTTLLSGTEAVSVSGSLLCGLQSAAGGSALMRWGDPEAATNQDRTGELVSSMVLYGGFDTLVEAPSGSLLAANLTLGNLQGISDDQPLLLAVDVPTTPDEALFEDWRNVLIVDTTARKVTPDWSGSSHTTLRYWDSTLASGCSVLGVPDSACETLDDGPRFTSGRLSETAAACEALATQAVPLLRDDPSELLADQLAGLPVLLPDQPALVDAGSDWEGAVGIGGCEGTAPLDIGASGGTCAPWFLNPDLVPLDADAADTGSTEDSGQPAGGAYVFARGCRWAGAVVVLLPLGLLRRRSTPCS